MKKKILVAMLAAGMVLSCVGCGETTVDREDNSQQTQEQNDKDDEQENPTMDGVEEVGDDEKWYPWETLCPLHSIDAEGKYDKGTTVYYTLEQRVYLDFACNRTLADSTHETFTLFQRWDDDAIKYATVEYEDTKEIDDFFPGHFNCVKEAIEGNDIRSKFLKNVEFEIESKENVIINEYEMCRYTGRLKAEDKDEKFDWYYCMYVTKTLVNDQFFYWMTVDTSEDQSWNDRADKFAYWTALSIYEEE